MDKVRTHEKADSILLGNPVILEKGKAVIELSATREMVVDDRGLVHGGFTFGLADYAAMLAVNDPYVVLGSADVLFTAPVKAGDRMVATGLLESSEGKRRDVSVEVLVDDRVVLRGAMTCYVLERHVLDA
jgi:acyl-coenzyme A thioesterase PaaI-like protein